MTVPPRPPQLLAALPLDAAVPSARAQPFGPPKAQPDLPAPFDTKPVAHPSRVIGWPAGKMPSAPTRPRSA